jgi:hypothetical protein
LRYAKNLDGPTDLRRWFRYVNQRLGEVSMMKRMNWDQLRISRTARKVERKFPISRWAMS